MDVRAVLRHLRRHILWVIAGTILGTAAFATVALLMKPVYRSTAVLISVSSERGLGGSVGAALGSAGGGLAALAGLNISSEDSATKEALGVLRSRQFGEDFIRDLNLMPVLYPKQWDSANNRWRADIRHPPTINKAFNYFDKNIRTVIEDNKTGLISVQIDWRNPTVAAAWANEIVRRLNAQMRVRETTHAEASISFLEKELQNTSVLATREAIDRLLEAQEKQRMLANVTEQYSFRVVDPAIAADPDDPVRPPKFLLLVSGPLVGLAFAVAFVLILIPQTRDGRPPGSRLQDG